MRDEGRLESVAQPAAGASYAAKIDGDDAAIDWRLARRRSTVASARSIRRRARAAAIGGRKIKVWRASPEESTGDAPPGRVVAADARGIVVACGEGMLRIVEIQQAGGRRMDAAAFVAGRHVAAGSSFDVGPARAALTG